jgi:dipeptidase E
MTKLLLTSSGISNKSIGDTLEQLLGKPISESNALFVPTGVYPVTILFYFIPFISPIL